MDTEGRYTRITLRIPRDLHKNLAEHAERTSKSMNAEIIARLEESFEIEAALSSIAPDASVTGTSGLLLDMHEQLEQREDDAVHYAASAKAERFEEHMVKTESELSHLRDQLAAIHELLQVKKS